MKAKHRILAAGMAAAMTLSLAACGGSASTAEPTASSTVEAAAPEATSEAAGGDVTEVTWWTYFGDKNIGYLQNIIDDFNNSQNQYHVTIVYQGNQMECNAKLQSTEKENLPAMFSGAVEDVAMYANSDFCVPLQKYVDADTEGWQELDDTWDALRSAYSDGQGNLIGYPIGYSYPNIFYNADLLKKAGVDPASIQSFDDLYDASKTIVDGGFATYGIGFFANGAMFNVALGREGVQAYNNENGLNGQPVTECLPQQRADSRDRERQQKAGDRLGVAGHRAVVHLPRDAAVQKRKAVAGGQRQRRAGQPKRGHKQGAEPKVGQRPQPDANRVMPRLAGNRVAVDRALAQDVEHNGQHQQRENGKAAALVREDNKDDVLEHDQHAEEAEDQ